MDQNRVVALVSHMFNRAIVWNGSKVRPHIRAVSAAGMPGYLLLGGGSIRMWSRLKVE
jgi:hypothetical protein